MADTKQCAICGKTIDAFSGGRVIARSRSYLCQECVNVLEKYAKEIPVPVFNVGTVIKFIAGGTFLAFTLSQLGTDTEAALTIGVIGLPLFLWALIPWLHGLLSARHIKKPDDIHPDYLAFLPDFIEEQQPAALNGSCIGKLIAGGFFLIFGFTELMTDIGTGLFSFAIALPLILWAVNPWIANSVRTRYVAAIESTLKERRIRIRKEKESALKVCPNCGATTRGSVCEYCGSKLPES